MDDVTVDFGYDPSIVKVDGLQYHTAFVDDWHLPLGHERYIYDEIKHQRYDTIIDVGAHVGTWSLRFSNMADRVYAFEADPDAYYILVCNILRNNKTNVIPLNMAVSNFNSATSFRDLMLYRHDNRGHNTITNTRVANVAYMNPYIKQREIAVKCVSLDFIFSDIKLGRVLVKIDVEGHEVEVIDGMREILSKYNPSVLVEVHDVEKEVFIKSKLGRETRMNTNGKQIYLFYRC